MDDTAEVIHSASAAVMAIVLVVACAWFHISHGPSSEPVLDALTSLATGYAFGRSSGSLPKGSRE